MNQNNVTSIGDAIQHLTDELVAAYKSLAGARMDLWTAEKDAGKERQTTQEFVHKLLEAHREIDALKAKNERLMEENRRLDQDRNSFNSAVASDIARLTVSESKHKRVIQKLWKSRRKIQRFARNAIA